ncbi:hypothetical protein [Corynebacterium pygosceleis]|uniref:hypothetical protein n=1 Tax=Corynebacterium pygosceleis TaxID=2800406 RepID=UPI0020047CDF|nr:hypothetical protein [Corynebacterium pygosceleis]MCK7676343.1 hypothetical protein [Corynebacterium pygosceleis]
MRANKPYRYAPATKLRRNITELAVDTTPHLIAGVGLAATLAIIGIGFTPLTTWLTNLNTGLGHTLAVTAYTTQGLAIFTAAKNSPPWENIVRNTMKTINQAPI